MENIAKGKVKLVKYTEEGSWLQPTINKGEKVPTEIFYVLENNEYVDDQVLYSISNTEENYDEMVSTFCEAEAEGNLYSAIENIVYNGEMPDYEGDAEARCVTDLKPYILVYDTSRSSEENQGTISDYFRTLFEYYPQYSVGTTINQISNFFKYHVMDMVECFGNMDEVAKFWKKLIESYGLNPEYKEELREEIRLSRQPEGETSTLSLEEAKKMVQEELAQINVDEYIQDLEKTIDTYCKEAGEIMKRLEVSVSPLEKETEQIKLDDKVKHFTPGEMVARLYRKTVEMGEYDVKEGNAPIGRAWKNGVTMENMPAEMANYYENESKKGCCFVFSTVIMKYLHDLGVKTWLITTNEDGDQRASFMYVDANGEPFVANPVADVEFFTSKGINNPEERDRFFSKEKYSAAFGSREDHHNYSRIPLYEFEEMYGPIATYGDFYNEKQKGVKFSEVHPHQIDVKEVYEHLGKSASYDWYEQKSKRRNARNANQSQLEEL